MIMLKGESQSFFIGQKRRQKLEREWRELCARYLPLAQSDSIWRHHGVRSPEEPTQGWKLHVSATVLNAPKVLARVAPFLTAQSVQFKAPSSLTELIKINSGLFYGYTQVGKIITVYPRGPEEAVSLACRLHKLTHHFTGPAVPFDLRFRPASNIYYRFGAFKHLKIEHRAGQRTLAIQAPNGELVPDVRTTEQGGPDWVRDPFDAQQTYRQRRKGRNPLTKNFRVLRAIVQRGKGGVYQAIDLSSRPPRLCLLKEGRKNGELTWDGRDGAWSVRKEEHVLAQLTASGVVAPRVYSSFELEGNYYLVTEFIAGECLHNILAKLQRRMALRRALNQGLQLAVTLSQIHTAGWVWRDCKPANIIVTPDGELRPLDFEGACQIDSPDSMLWGTPGFTPPEWRELNLKTGLAHDLYALGSMLYLLLTGQVPAIRNPHPIEGLRRQVPREIRALIMCLLSHDLQQRSAAKTVAEELKAALVTF